jgi:hypothetical protein
MILSRQTGNGCWLLILCNLNTSEVLAVMNLAVRVKQMNDDCQLHADFFDLLLISLVWLCVCEIYL